jgi:hypothetical protein
MSALYFHAMHLWPLVLVGDKYTYVVLCVTADRSDRENEEKKEGEPMHER